MTCSMQKLATHAANISNTADDWREAFSMLATALDDMGRDTKPASAQFWHGPFEWSGGECPLPPDALIWPTFRDGSSGCPGVAGVRHWGHDLGSVDITSFSYAADNPEGWIERPAGWVPPDKAWPLETRTKYGGGKAMAEKQPWCWTGPRDMTTHIRLLPRQAKPAPSPTPEVVREALEAVNLHWRLEYTINDQGAKGKEAAWQKVMDALAALDTQQPTPQPAPDVVREALEEISKHWHSHDQAAWARMRDKLDKALAALDAAESETLGWAILCPGGWVGYRCRSADEARQRACPKDRIVRLVAEKEPK